jgi:SAM-dependent methyltransferase
MIYGWDHPETARRYEQFCARHERYQIANQQLVEHAEIAAGLDVLDIAAGTGRTAELAVAGGARVVCWEPAEAMRNLGKSRVPQADWRDRPPEGLFDRVLCGAAAWQWQPFRELVHFAGGMVRKGGALIFNIPSLYLGIADEPGGGKDPHLLELANRLARGAVPDAAPTAQPLDLDMVEATLTDAGFELSRWMFRVRLTQACLSDWRRIPVITDALLGALDAAERDARIDEACQALNDDSWKWEGWTGWTAWKR